MTLYNLSGFIYGIYETWLCREKCSLLTSDLSFVAFKGRVTILSPIIIEVNQSGFFLGRARASEVSGRALLFLARARHIFSGSGFCIYVVITRSILGSGSGLGRPGPSLCSTTQVLRPRSNDSD